MEVILTELCKALGWQGGTIHDVIDEIKRLRAAELHSISESKIAEQELSTARAEIEEQRDAKLESEKTANDYYGETVRLGCELRDANAELERLNTAWKEAWKEAFNQAMSNGTELQKAKAEVERLNLERIVLRDELASSKVQRDNAIERLAANSGWAENEDSSDLQEAVSAIREFVSHRDSVQNHPIAEVRLSMTADVLRKFYSILDKQDGRAVTGEEENKV